jgi:predicted HNH restriction endonuclease
MKGKRNVSALTKRIVAANASWRCEACDNVVSASYEIDHRIPLWKGGTNEISNLQCLCAECHSQKTVQENQEREEKRRMFSSLRRPPLQCVQCLHIVSPYFDHICKK